MPAKSDPLALMFHSKKKNGSGSSTPIPRKKQQVPPPNAAATPQPSSQPPSRPASQSQPTAAAAAAAASPFPSGPYQEWTLYSGITDEWRYDVMKFEHRKNVELEKWTQPVKLNRRELRRRGGDDGQEGPQAVGPMLGLDGKPVVGMDGRHIMIDAQGRPIHNTNGSGGGRGGGRGGRGGGGRKFQKKTRQVFMVPDETRQLRKEERYPWVIEDATGTETWTAAMEEVSKSTTHAMFLPAADSSSFFFNTLHRWYKFQRKPNHDVPNLEEAEELMNKIQKNKEPARWLLKKRGLQVTDAAVAKLKLELDAERNSASGSGAGGSLGPGGRRLRTVNSGADDDLFGGADDDEDAGARRRARELGRHGDLEEVDFEDVFEDDEQTMEVDEKEDEETKEIDARLQREFDAANKAREGLEDDDMDDLEFQLSKAGKGLQKLMKKHATDSDEEGSDREHNPYASSDEEEEEEVPVPQTGPAIQQQTDGAAKDVKPTLPLPSVATAGGNQLPTSRATSPVAPSLGGHSIVAKRAAGPKVPRPKASAGSRATSPLAGGLSSRATSPATSSRASSPPVAGSKRKADDGSGDNAAPVSKPKKAKSDAKASAVSMAREVTLPEIVEWFEKHPNSTTKDCSQAFRPFLGDDARRKRFITKTKSVVISHDGFLSLRPNARALAGMPPAA